MTWLGHPDVAAWSHERRFRLEAVSPDHPDGSGFGEREDFRYTLTEEGKFVWVAEQAAVSQIPPRDLYVSDRGWSVVRTHSHFPTSLVGLSPLGERLFEFQAEELFAPGRLERFAGWTSVGCWWNDESHAWFPILEGREHFCLRTRWGDRVLVDLERRQKVDDQPYRDELEAHEAAWVLETLRLMETHETEWNGSWPDDDASFRPTLESAIAAIVLAGHSRVQQAEALLRKFESLRLVRWRTSCPPLSEEDLRPESASDNDWFGHGQDLEYYMFRAPATVALRRIGATPTGFSSCRISRRSDATALVLPEFIPDLVARAETVRTGMPLINALMTLGSPNRLGGLHWDWDLEDEQTLRLRFDYEYDEKIARIDGSELLPAAWKTED